MTTSVSGARAFTARSTSKPSAPGMRRSVTTTSYGSPPRSAMARVPSAAVSTWYPSPRMRTKSFRMFSLSSTTSTRGRGILRPSPAAWPAAGR